MVTRLLLRRASRARSSERGAAIFIVVLVITLLSAIGVFAARASSMAEMVSGYDRQASQDHYVAEYGLLGAVTELSGPTRDLILARLKYTVPGDPADVCSLNANIQMDAGADGAGIYAAPPCYKFTTTQLANDVSSATPGRNLFEPASSTDGGTPIPGSLGASALVGRVEVQVTDRGPVGVLVPGSNLGGGAQGQAFGYDQVTLTATGQVAPATAATSCTDTQARGAQNVAGNESGRAYVIVGPIAR